MPPAGAVTIELVTLALCDDPAAPTMLPPSTLFSAHSVTLLLIFLRFRCFPTLAVSGICRLLTLCFLRHMTLPMLCCVCCDSSDLELEGVEKVSLVLLFPLTVGFAHSWRRMFLSKHSGSLLGDTLGCGEPVPGGNEVPSQASLAWR